jgi:GNAT superfamily N-acetyltransferase
MLETNINPPLNPGIESLRWLAANRLQEIGEEWDDYSMGPRPQVSPMGDPAEVVTAAAEYVSSQRVGYLGGGTFYELALGGHMAAQLTIEMTDDNTARVDYYNVLKPLQGRGIGGRLMRSAVKQLKADGITELFSDNISRQALMVRSAIFGEQALQFYTTNEFSSQVVKPRDFGDAVNVINEIYRAHDLTSSKSDPETFGVYVDLTSVDTTGWENPLPASNISDFTVDF